MFCLQLADYSRSCWLVLFYCGFSLDDAVSDLYTLHGFVPFMFISCHLVLLENGAAKASILRKKEKRERIALFEIKLILPVFTVAVSQVS